MVIVDQKSTKCILNYLKQDKYDWIIIAMFILTMYSILM